VRSSQTFFMWTVYFQRVWFKLCSLLNGHNLGSVASVKTVLLLKWRHNEFRGGRDLSQNVWGRLTNPIAKHVTVENYLRFFCTVWQEKLQVLCMQSEPNE